MSIEVMTAVWKRSAAKGGDLLVLLALADNANDDGVAWPSQPTLARKARITERQVRRAIANLIASGEVSLAKRGNAGKSSVYRLHIDNMTGGQNDHVDTGGLSTRTPTSAEPSLTVIEEETDVSSSAKITKAERDAMFDAVCEVCGMDPKRFTKSEGGDVGKTVNELLAAGATPADVRRVSARWVEKYRMGTMSVHSLRNRWSQLLALSGHKPEETPQEKQARVEADRALAKELGWIS